MAKKKSPINETEVLETPVVEETAVAAEPTESEAGEAGAVETPAEETVAPKKKGRVRGQKYVEARSMVDRTIAYPATQAIDLLKTTSYAKFGGTVTVHINLKREIKPFDVTFPYSTGKTARVVIADDQVLADLAEGKIEFDVLITTPDRMPKLAKFARLLGPKGLMPNPKNGTVTSDPEAKKKQLEGGATSIKPEKKANLMHIRLGKVSQGSEELAGNLSALLAAMPPNSVAKVTVAPTMGPGIKVQFA